MRQFESADHAIAAVISGSSSSWGYWGEFCAHRGEFFFWTSACLLCQRPLSLIHTLYFFSNSIWSGFRIMRWRDESWTHNASCSCSSPYATRVAEWMWRLGAIVMQIHRSQKSWFVLISWGTRMKECSNCEMQDTMIYSGMFAWSNCFRAVPDDKESGPKRG